jgi:hypothetical protein
MGVMWEVPQDVCAMVQAGGVAACGIQTGGTLGCEVSLAVHWEAGGKLQAAWVRLEVLQDAHSGVLVGGASACRQWESG